MKIAVRSILSTATILVACTMSATSKADATQASPQAPPGPASAAPPAGESRGPATAGTTMDHTISAFANMGYSYGFALGLALLSRNCRGSVTKRHDFRVVCVGLA